MPWKAYSPYVFAVTPGDAACAKGRGVTFTVAVRPVRSKVPPATSGTLVLVDADGNAAAHKMQPAGPGEFTLDCKVPGDLTYRVEARAAFRRDAAVSDDYHLTAVTPVELAADSPVVTVTPPAYARAAEEVQTVHGLADLGALRSSAVRFAFRFTRPAVAASLEWTGAEVRSSKEGTKAASKTTAYTLVLTHGGKRRPS